MTAANSLRTKQLSARRRTLVRKPRLSVGALCGREQPIEKPQSRLALLIGQRRPAQLLIESSARHVAMLASNDCHAAMFVTF